MNVNGHCEELERGVWVSPSHKSFQDYSENVGKHNREARYAGWPGNDIPECKISENSPTIVLQDKKVGDPTPSSGRLYHRLVGACYNETTKVKTEKRPQELLNVVNERDREATPSKPWRKL